MGIAFVPKAVFIAQGGMYAGFAVGLMFRAKAGAVPASLSRLSSLSLSLLLSLYPGAGITGRRHHWQ